MTRAVLCCRCGRPVPDGWLCRHCGAAVARLAVEVADLFGEAQTTVARQARHGADGPRGVELPLPLSLHGAAHVAAAGAVVLGWARQLAVLVGLPRMPAGLLVGPACGRACRHGSCRRIRWRLVDEPAAAAARWLAGQVDWLRTRPDVADLLGDLEAVRRELRRLADGPRPRVFAGPCREPAAGGGLCEAELYAAPGSDTVRCRECGTVHDTAARRAWLLGEVDDVLAHAELTARAISALGVPVTGSQVRNWASRGRLMRKGYDHADRPTYRVGDVLGLAVEAAAAAEQRRARTAATMAGRAEQHRQALAAEAATVADRVSTGVDLTSR